MEMEYDEEYVKEEAAKLIQRRWREVSKKTPEQLTVGVEDTAQLEKEKRERLLLEYRELAQQREKLLTENFAHQRKLSHYFHEKKGQEEKHATHEQSLMEVETRYMQWLTRLRDERMEVEATQRSNEESIEEFKHRLQSHLYKANEFEAKFKDFKKDKSTKAEFSRTGKGIPTKRIQQFEEEEEQRNEEVRNVRINYIKMRNRMKKLVHLLKEKEKLTDGLHLIDFEQLKIENTTLNEKIEERNEDLLKLRKKATTTIHILTHVKEKLQFIQGENQVLRKQLAKLEEELQEHRDSLNQVKRDRDALVNDNVKMREKMPMVGAEDLLVDYEYRKKEIERLRAEVVTLKNKHHELFVWIAKNAENA
eukprot:TRINITY_DN1078_c0_g1_i1.p1 TRINITY_DN1078_c0_g1~~TRINITY_DN1078_c0_g1_i1.p1  ORF type:complete len:364 (-),score=153.54 TRINITY_DN1078_c0_g1_i1:163-1254(-)